MTGGDSKELSGIISGKISYLIKLIALVGISGYVPFYNNAKTVLAAVDSLRCQRPALGEVFAIDDGSTDQSAALLEAAGVRVLRQPANLGRGAARRRAMEVAKHDFVLCCDATNILPASFSLSAMAWFEDPNVAAVVGWISDPNPSGVVSRWRARNLFKAGVKRSASRGADLVTYGAMVRASAVASVGGYDQRLRHTEDIELGNRLIAASYVIVQDPALEVFCNVKNTLPEVLERFWRWNTGKDEAFSFGNYLKMIKYASRFMAWQDLRAGDPLSCGISLLVPHYQLWRFIKKRLHAP